MGGRLFCYTLKYNCLSSVPILCLTPWSLHVTEVQACRILLCPASYVCTLQIRVIKEYYHAYSYKWICTHIIRLMEPLATHFFFLFIHEWCISFYLTCNISYTHKHTTMGTLRFVTCNVHGAGSREKRLKIFNHFKTNYRHMLFY